MALIAPLPPILERGVAVDGDKPILGPNDLISKLGEKSSFSSLLRLPKLRLDADIISCVIQ
jgi:hypothetical protein